MSRTGRALSVVALVVLVALTALISFSNAFALPALRSCEMEALKSFGPLRKPNEHGVLWPPHPLEYYYIAPACVLAVLCSKSAPISES